MTPYYDHAGISIYCGDVAEVLPTLEPESFDACLCDPPYGLKFMGKAWDHGVPGAEVWREVLRVLKPGAHLLAFGGTRTFHRLTCAIEDAGWEIRDCLMWLYGSGFPKSLGVSKALDKAAGVERERIRGVRSGVVGSTFAQDAWSKEFKDSVLSSEPITEGARAWVGWGTALKPAWEPIVLAMKPLAGTFAQNALAHGVAGLNIDGCRIGIEARVNLPMGAPENSYGGYGTTATATATTGRWPANVVLDEETAAMLDEQGGFSEQRPQVIRRGPRAKDHKYGEFPNQAGTLFEVQGDSGGASRFFYCAKASRSEREAGLTSEPEKGGGHRVGVANSHPT